MRISDWSSDVCSSDIARTLEEHLVIVGLAELFGILRQRIIIPRIFHRGRSTRLAAGIRRAGVVIGHDVRNPALLDIFGEVTARSEEHTSELQSLMRISYAVF